MAHPGRARTVAALALSLAPWAGCGSTEPASEPDPADHAGRAERAAPGPADEPDPPAPAAEPDTPLPATEPDPVRTLAEPETLEARLEHAPHDTPRGAPDAIVHLPAGLRVDQDLSVVVFLHGWSGCTRALVGSGRVPCRRGGRPVRGWGLAARHDAANTDTLLLVPQLAWLARDGSPGRLAEDGFFRDMLAELLAGPLSEALGTARGVEDIGTITLVAHSAGYESALAILEHGGVDVAHVVLLDSLYAGAEELATWAADGGSGRLLSLYTGHASTHRQSHLLARLCGDALGVDAVATDPDAPLAEALSAHRVVVAPSPYPHGAIPTRQLEQVLRALPLPARE